MEYKNDYFADDQLSEDEIQEDDYEKELINWYSTYPVERKRKLNKRERYEKEQKTSQETRIRVHTLSATSYVCGSEMDTKGRVLLYFKTVLQAFA